MTAKTAKKRKWTQWIFWIIAAIVVIVLVTAFFFVRAITPPTPTAFYTPPDPLPAGAPGSIIRSEQITTNVPEGAVAWRVLYQSTGIDGEPVAVSGLVIAPEEESTSPRPVVAWAHGTVGVLPECGLSHTPNPFEDIPAVELLVNEGYVIAATDYPGLGTPGIHPYLVGPVEAAAVLDSVRAARELDVDAGDQFVIWGASQGGHATMWAAQSAPEYAPELTLLGAAAAAPALDLPGIFEWGLDKRAGAIVISEALYAWDHFYEGINLDDVVDPELRDKFEEIARTCISTPLRFLLAGNIPTPEQFLMVDPLTTEPYRTILDENVPTNPINVPILISHGTGDSLIPFEGSVNVAAERCAAGEDVQLVRYPGVEHPAALESAIMTVGWIDDRFAGRPTSPNCGE